MSEAELDALALALIEPQLQRWLDELQREKDQPEQKERAA